MYLEDAYKVAKSTILAHKETMEKIAELLIKKEYISGEDFSVMVENPDKIEEFKNADEVVRDAEQISPNPSLSRGEKDSSLIKEGDHEVVEDLDSSTKPQNDKWNTKGKKTAKKPTSRKKS